MAIVTQGPLNSGTVTVKNQSDLNRSRVQLKYLVVEGDVSLALSIDDAITNALATAASDTTVTKYGNIVRQDATASRLGPRKVEVTVNFARTPAPPAPSGEIISLSTSAATVPVYRLPAVITQTGGTKPDGSTCSGGPCTTPSIGASGLPSGDWADSAKLAGQVAPVKDANPRAYPWAVPQVSVQIPGKLTQAEFEGIHTGSGAMTKVGYWNSNLFTWGNIPFPVETLRFNGCNAQWVQENGVFVYYVRYDFTWRPEGWYEQIAVENSATPGLLTTQDLKLVGQTVTFNSTLFPV